MRYFAELAYNGTNYHGWQIQPNANSVQETIEKAFGTILRKKDFSCVGCGRTDTGVHASQYFIHFDLEEEINSEQLVRKINSLLPHDIVIYKVDKVNPELHARFDATERTYKYCITTVKNPFKINLAYKFSIPLNIERMNEAAAQLLHIEDFASFSKAHSDVKTTICDVRFAQWEKSNHELIFTITADRFLRNMVRAIVGTLLLVGEEKISIEEFKSIVEKKNRSKAGRSVPGHGLFLHEIKY